MTEDEFPSGRWRARWIWNTDAPISLTSGAQPVIDAAAARGFVLLRRRFSIDSIPSRAPSRCTADSRYILWVNGVELSRGPVRGNPQRLRYDMVDLAPHLGIGDNVVAVLARYYGEPTPWWIPSTPTFALGGGAFLFEAALGEPLDPDATWLTSDASWRTLDPTTAWDEQRGGGIGDMPIEICDARNLPVHWQHVDFDDAEWADARELAAYSVGYLGDPHPPTHPYGPLLGRPIPQLTGSTRPGAIVTRGVVERHNASSHDNPVAQFSADEKRVQRWTAVAPTTEPLTTGHPASDCEVFIFDFGEQVAGHVVLDIDAPPGARVDAKAAEALTSEGRLESLQQQNGFRYLARGHDDVFETFDKVGLRYLGVSIRSDSPVTIKSLSVRERLFARHTITSRSPGAGTEAVPYFECSDQTLNDIYRIGRRTVDLCSQDAYLDCPSREQRAWTGDSVVHQMVDLTTNLDWTLAKWNLELCASPRRDGMLPMVSGGDMEIQDTAFIPDWALHWMHALHNLWMYTGDRDFVSAMLPVAERMLAWFVPFQDRDGLLDNVTGWVIIDWAAVHGQGKSAALNGLWARALREFALISDAVEDRGRAEWSRGLWRRVRDGFECFWDPARGLYVDNIVHGRPERRTSQHANAAALVAGVVPDHRREALAKAMVDPARLEHAAWLMPGKVATAEGSGDMYAGFSYLMTGPPDPWWDVENKIVAAQPFFRYVVHDAVAAAGLADLIPGLCRDWQVLIPRSATTWSEVFYGGSHCHGWSSTPTRDLVQRTLGVTPASPGFKTAHIAPALGDLEWAKGAVPTPFGLIHIEITRSGIEVQSPVPTTTPSN